MLTRRSLKCATDISRVPPPAMFCVREDSAPLSLRLSPSEPYLSTELYRAPNGKWKRRASSRGNSVSHCENSMKIGPVGAALDPETHIQTHRKRWLLIVKEDEFLFSFITFWKNSFQRWSFFFDKLRLNVARFAWRLFRVRKLLLF